VGEVHGHLSAMAIVTQACRLGPQEQVHSVLRLEVHDQSMVLVLLSLVCMCLSSPYVLTWSASGVKVLISSSL
jgi:hypothetical protein